MTKREKIEELRGKIAEQERVVDWLSKSSPYKVFESAGAWLENLRRQLAALEAEERDE